MHREWLCMHLALLFALGSSISSRSVDQCTVPSSDHSYGGLKPLDESCGSAEPLDEIDVVFAQSYPAQSSHANADRFVDSLFEYSSVLTSHHLPAFARETNWTEVWFAFEEAALGTYEFLRLWLVFLRLIAVPVLKCLEIILEALLPHLLNFLAYLLACFQRLEPVYQAGVVLAVVFSGVCYRQGYLRKAKALYGVTKGRMWVRYRAIIDSIARKSRVAALLLPHMAFVLIGYLVVTFSSSSIVWLLGHESIFSLLALWYPFLRSMRVIRETRMLEEQATARAIASTNQHRPLNRIDYEPHLKYSVLYALAVCVHTLFRAFIPSFVAAYVPFSLLWANLTLLWIHLPITRGDLLLFSVLSRYLSPYANRIVDVNDTFRARAGAGAGAGRGAGAGANANQPVDEHVNIVFRTLTAIGVLPNHVGHLLQDLWHQGPALVALIFLFTPGFVTSRGCICLGFGFPAYVTMGALAQKKTRLYEWWLLYFCVVVVIDYIYDAVAVAFSWAPLFYHVKLLVMMWLQFPYFRGAQTIFDAVLMSVFINKKKRD